MCLYVVVLKCFIYSLSLPLRGCILTNHLSRWNCVRYASFRSSTLGYFGTSSLDVWFYRRASCRARSPAIPRVPRTTAPHQSMSALCHCWTASRLTRSSSVEGTGFRRLKYIFKASILLFFPIVTLKISLVCKWVKSAVNIDACTIFSRT